MSRRWSEMTEEKRTELRLHLAVDLAADELASAPAPADTARRPRFDEIHAAALNPAEAMDESLTAALTADAEARETFEALLRDAALCWFPAAAAAADGEGLDMRAEDGFSVQILPSSAEGDQVYLLIRCAEGRDSKPSALIVFPAKGAPVRAVLPEDIDGVYQLVEHRDSLLVRAIRDPASRLALA